MTCLVFGYCVSKGATELQAKDMVPVNSRLVPRKTPRELDGSDAGECRLDVLGDKIWLINVWVNPIKPLAVHSRIPTDFINIKKFKANLIVASLADWFIWPWIRTTVILKSPRISPKTRLHCLVPRSPFNTKQSVYQIIIINWWNNESKSN